MNLLLIICLVSLVICLLFIIRNNMVGAYRHRVISKIYNEAIQAIYANRKATLNYDILDTVSYDSMLLKFWKPLESFFPEEYRV
jgi:hypothetical protein